MTTPVFLTTLDEVALDDACGMKLWFTKYHTGAGITERSSLLREEILLTTQSDLRTLSRMEDISIGQVQAMIDEILGALTTDQKRDLPSMELLYRRLGWMAAYALYVEPMIRKLYLTVPLDEDIELSRSPLIVKMKAGRALRNRTTSELEYREFVPTHTVSARWRDSWETHIRPHVGLIAAREALQRRFHYARIQGLALGVTPSYVGAKLRHPYVYGFRNKRTGEWTHDFKLSSELDWEERPTWEYPLPLTQWITKCGATVADTQFPLSPKVNVNEGMVQMWVDRRIHRERALNQVKTSSHYNRHIRSLHFSQVSEKCSPVHTAPCAFRELCWSEPYLSKALEDTKFLRNPLTQGHFLRREEIERPSAATPESLSSTITRIERIALPPSLGPIEQAVNLLAETRKNLDPAPTAEVNVNL